jgi:hypothetical protein
VELVKIDLEYRWRLAAQSAPPARAAWGPLGACPRVEDYLRHYPELQQPGPPPLDLWGEEYRARHRWGDGPPHEEYTTRLPGHPRELRELLTRIDAELAAERRAQAAALARGAGAGPRPGPPAGLEGSSPAAILEGMVEAGLLAPAQAQELNQAEGPPALYEHLLERGWLTAYQVNELAARRWPVVGPYLLLERLGEGGTGQVFKARHRQLQRVVALKVLREELVGDPEVVARFYREVEVVRKLSHPNVIRAFDAGPVEGVHVLALEHVDGLDLQRLVKQ